MKINRGFPLPLPIYAGRMHNLCLYLKQHDARLLTSKPKHFAQTFSRAFLVSFIGTHLPSPLTNAIDVEETYKNGTQESGGVRLQ